MEHYYRTHAVRYLERCRLMYCQFLLIVGEYENESEKISVYSSLNRFFFADSVAQTLEQLLVENKPAFLSKLVTQTVSFGTNAPKIFDIRPFDDGKVHTGPRILLEANFILDATDMDVTIVAMLTKFIPITVTVNKACISGKSNKTLEVLSIKPRKK